jgi:hypothetical protein
MEKCRWTIGGILVLGLVCLVTSSPATEEKAPPNEKAVAGADGEAVFDMVEVSLFDEKARGAVSQVPMYGGQSVPLSAEPSKDVKAYPKLNSKRPLYGAIVLKPDPEKPGAGTKFYFVLDESAVTEKSGEETEKAEEKPTKSRYDRLYIDFNRDLDLTNDAAVSPMKDPPKSFARFGAGPQNTVVFDTISVSLGDDPQAKATVRLLPVMFAYGNAGQMMFTSASARKGDIRLGKQAYTALLFSQKGALGRMDRPDTRLILTPTDGAKLARTFSAMSILGAIRQADGEYYKLSATPSGDKLTVRVMGGDRGVLELSAGKKEIKPLGIVGVLNSGNAMMPLGEMSYPMGSERADTAQFRLPVGNYQPYIMIVDCGDLRIMLRADYTRISRGGAKSGGIEIRKDKPFVLDLTTKPVLDFQSPPKGKTFKPGDQIRLAGMLKIPDKGLMIGDLEDMSKKIGEMSMMGDDGKPVSIPRYASLDPTVVITNSSGKKVAEGKMPFG